MLYLEEYMEHKKCYGCDTKRVAVRSKSHLMDITRLNYYTKHLEGS